MTDFIRQARTYTDSTGALATTEETLTGDAIRISKVRESEKAQFAEGAVIGETAVLLWIGADYDADLRPKPGDMVTWEDVAWTVAWVNPIAPDGVTLAARVGVAR